MEVDGQPFDVRFCPNDEEFGPCDELTLPNGDLALNAAAYNGLALFFLRRARKLEKYADRKR